jgi:hypothetical protein
MRSVVTRLGWQPEAGMREPEVGMTAAKTTKVGMVGSQKTQQLRGPSQPSQPFSELHEGGGKEHNRGANRLCVRGLRSRLGGRDGWDVARPTFASALHELAEQLEHLRPNWQRPETFFDRRADLAARLRDIALSHGPQDPWRPPERRPAILPPPERERRFLALLTAKEAELEQLRRALASAVPKVRRRRLVDDRQLCLVLATDGR